ncbi:hypothetical protein OVY48_06520 [Sphingobium sp. SA2]|uniref:hypothetical protein n=1 Tax=Sphingobium sp. SA2 TaxID=1524832 RepID=UPI0028C1091E|nr:hypothetical protein [Sphingobium sp. SA2]MDT7533089.1 hypothetical protein [Sphingobium sp. SA2]
MTETVDTPIACTLDAGNLKERLDWIADLNARTLRSSKHDDLTLVLDYAPGAIDDVRRMVAGEQACCAFLAFDLAELDGLVRLTVTAPEDAREAAEALFEPFASKGDTTIAAGPCGCTGACGT